MGIESKLAAEARSHDTRELIERRFRNIEKLVLAVPIIQQQQNPKDVTRAILSRLLTGRVIEEVKREWIRPSQRGGYGKEWSDEVEAFVQLSLGLNTAPAAKRFRESRQEPLARKREHDKEILLHLAADKLFGLFTLLETETEENNFQTVSHVLDTLTASADNAAQPAEPILESLLKPTKGSEPDVDGSVIPRNRLQETDTMSEEERNLRKIIVRNAANVYYMQEGKKLLEGLRQRKNTDLDNYLESRNLTGLAKEFVLWAVSGDFWQPPKLLVQHAYQLEKIADSVGKAICLAVKLEKTFSGRPTMEKIDKVALKIGKYSQEAGATEAARAILLTFSGLDIDALEGWRRIQQEMGRPLGFEETIISLLLTPNNRFI